MQLKNILYLWLPPLLWMALIFYLSNQPGLAIGEGAVDFWTRKPAHVAEYAALFVLLFRAIHRSFGKMWKVWEVHVGSGVLTFAYAISDEIHQSFVPLREGKIFDLGFDFLGVLIGSLAIYYIMKRLSKLLDI